MSRYLPRAERVVDFDGDSVTVSINRISMKDAMSFKQSEDRDAMMANTERLLRQYGVAFTGLKDAAGADVPIDTVFAEFYFSNLIGAAADLLMSTGEVPKRKENPLSAS